MNLGIYNAKQQNQDLNVDVSIFILRSNFVKNLDIFDLEISQRKNTIRQQNLSA